MDRGVFTASRGEWRLIHKRTLRPDTAAMSVICVMYTWVDVLLRMCLQHGGLDVGVGILITASIQYTYLVNMTNTVVIVYH